jgi:predicted ATPase
VRRSVGQSGPSLSSRELGAAMSMARFWRDQGRRDEARELLAPVYGWFTEGFDTLDSERGEGAARRTGDLIRRPVASVGTTGPRSWCP